MEWLWEPREEVGKRAAGLAGSGAALPYPGRERGQGGGGKEAYRCSPWRSESLDTVQ